MRKALPGFGLHVLSEHQLDTIHFATLRVLNEVGLRVEDRESTEIFSGHGYRVEAENQNWRVRIPA